MEIHDEKIIKKAAPAKRQIINALFDYLCDPIKPVVEYGNRDGFNSGTGASNWTIYGFSTTHNRGFCRCLASAALAVFALGSGATYASIITFETVSSLNPGFNFTRPVTEAGFTYSLAAGSLTPGINSGNPGWDIEGDVNSSGGGTLAIVSATPGGLFTFNGLDAAVASSIDPASAKPISLGITVTGNRQGSFVSTDLFLQKGDGTLNLVWQAQTSAPPSRTGHR